MTAARAKKPATPERLLTLLDEVLQQYFGPDFGWSPRMPHAVDRYAIRAGLIEP
jgi:hypothetical protein